MPHRYRCPLRWADLNVGGHVDHCVIIDYLQEARIELLASQPDPMGSMLAGGVLVTGHQVDYVAELLVGPEPLQIDLWIDQVGAARFGVSYRLFDVSGSSSGTEPRLVARARTFVVPYDLGAAVMRRLSPPERSQLQGLVEPAEQFGPLAKPGALPDRSHRWPLPVRWSELDSYGHVNNVKFAEYLAEARGRMLAEALQLDPARPGGVAGWAIARQDLDYLLPIDFRPEPYEVRTAVAEIGRTSLRLLAEIRDPLDGRRLARAGTVVVRTDRAAGAPAPWTPQEREVLARWQQ